MIIAKISGGLGNQMFQYVLIEALKKAYPKAEFKIDISDYEKVFAHTGYSLSKYFNIDMPVASIDEVDGISYIPVQCTRPDIQKGIKKLIATMQYKIALRKRKHLKKYNITDYCFNIYNPEVFHLDMRKNWYLNGYWQNTAYFKELQDQLTDLFVFRRKLVGVDQEIAIKMKNQQSVSVHVRRGDYINSGFALCGKAYYLEAKKIIEQQVENPVYYFFSDDPAYVEDNFPEFPDKIVIKHSAEDCDYDMQMMACCKHGINANSSFSFWGSALKAKGGTVVQPQFTLLREDKLYEGACMSSWIRLNNAGKIYG
ncbi:alpha-1,2-fucosyltransferase [Negativibacillus massiliensis]|uniref:alpha-1,2-fucosyltransferase n=1 Tax=Negativibacillus massiliensis TaxID=1871035 RepID=UPI003AF29DF5